MWPLMRAPRSARSDGPGSGSLLTSLGGVAILSGWRRIWICRKVIWVQACLGFSWGIVRFNICRDLFYCCCKGHCELLGGSVETFSSQL